MVVSSAILTALFGIATVTLILSHFFKPRIFLSLTGFLIPMMSIQLSLGINILFLTLVGPLSLILVLSSPRKNKRPVRVSAYSRFVTYVVVVSMIWMLLDYIVLHRYAQSEILGLAIAQTKLKLPVQLLGFLCQLSAFWIVPMRARSISDISSATNGFVFGCLSSVSIGLLLSVTTGIGVIGRPSGANFQIDGGAVSRIGGLSGEPKHLGAMLVIALTFCVSKYAYSRHLKNRTRQLTSITVLAIGLFLTYSTSAWLGFAVALVLLVSIGVWTSEQKSTSKRRQYLAIIVVLLVGIGSQANFISNMVQTRITKRVLDKETSELEESKDNLVWDIYSDRPFFALIGFGMGGTDFEALPYFLNDPKYAAHHQYGRPPTPATNGMRLLGDIGIIGLLLLSLAILEISKKLRVAGNHVLAMFGISGLAGLMFVSMNAVSAYLFLVGAGVASLQVRNKQRYSTTSQK